MTRDLVLLCIQTKEVKKIDENKVFFARASHCMIKSGESDKSDETDERA